MSMQILDKIQAIPRWARVPLIVTALAGSALVAAHCDEIAERIENLIPVKEPNKDIMPY